MSVVLRSTRWAASPGESGALGAAAGSSGALFQGEAFTSPAKYFCWMAMTVSGSVCQMGGPSGASGSEPYAPAEAEAPPLLVPKALLYAVPCLLVLSDQSPWPSCLWPWRV